MDDTSASITTKICELFQTKTPNERLEMGSAMYDTSKFLVTRAILEQNPNITKAGLRQELFLKFYRDDFDLESRQKILDYLHRNTPQ